MYGEDLIKHLNSVYKLAVGIKDYNIQIDQNCLFILLDTRYSKNQTLYNNNLTKFLKYIREKDYYVTDYLYDNMRERYSKHMIVLKIPEVFNSKNILLKFKQGLYSQMYESYELNLCFNSIHRQKAKKVLLKDLEYKKDFINKVNKDFGTNITIEDFKDAELDYPPSLWEETFNFKIT